MGKELLDFEKKLKYGNFSDNESKLLQLLRQFEVRLTKVDTEHSFLYQNEIYGWGRPECVYCINIFGNYDVNIFSDKNKIQHFEIKNFPLIDIKNNLNKLEDILNKSKIEVDIVSLAFAINNEALRYLEMNYNKNNRVEFWDSRTKDKVYSIYDRSHLTCYGRKEPPIKVIDLTKPLYSRIAQSVKHFLKGD